jgi:hypothetical protein
MDLVLGVINPVKKCLSATIYKCLRITIGRKGFHKISISELERYVRRTNIEISRYKREKETFLDTIGIISYNILGYHTVS